MTTLATTLSTAASLPGRVAVGLIRVYQVVLSPALPRSCRFHPTCSEYAAQAVSRHGIFRGLWLAVVRIAKCHPWHPGGHDPVE